MKVYAVQYCPCVYESDYKTISLHRTKKGAVAAITKNKGKELERDVSDLHFMNPFQESFLSKGTRIGLIGGSSMTHHRIEIMEVEE